MSAGVVAFDAGGSRRMEPRRGLADYALARLTGLFPDRIERSLSSPEKVRLFVATLGEELERRGITREMVEAGLQRIASVCEWPPVDVPVFVRYCLPVRDYAAAFAEAQRNAYRRMVGDIVPAVEWSHLAVYWAGDRFGWFEVRNLSWKEAQHRWTEVLDDVLGWGNWTEPDLERVTDRGGLQTAGAHRSAMAAAREILKMAQAGGAAAKGYERRDGGASEE